MGRRVHTVRPLPHLTCRPLVHLFPRRNREGRPTALGDPGGRYRLSPLRPSRPGTTFSEWLSSFFSFLRRHPHGGGRVGRGPLGCGGRGGSGLTWSSRALLVVGLEEPPRPLGGFGLFNMPLFRPSSAALNF